MKKMLNFITLVLFLLVFTNLSFASVTLDLSTGVNVGQLGNPLYPMTVGQRDDYWFVRSLPGNIAQPPNTKAWMRTGMGTAWNNIAGTRPIFGNNENVGTTEYERCFCISNLEGAKLDLQLRADNTANLFINQYFINPIMQTPNNSTFSSAQQPVTKQYTAQTGLKVGKNCIRVRVNNEGGPAGFALKATLQAVSGQDTFQENGCCQQGAPVFSAAFKIATNGRDILPQN